MRTEDTANVFSVYSVVRFCSVTSVVLGEDLRKQS